MLGSKKAALVLGRTAAWSLKILWVGVMLVAPLLGVWLSSSLAAYHNGPLWLCLALGLLMFPALPVAWDQWYLWRKRRSQPERKRILTGLDRLVLRTLALNLAFLVAVVGIAPSAAFRALSTRGDWMLDGRDGPVANEVRDYVFAVADILEVLYRGGGDEPYGESDAPPDVGDDPDAGGDGRPEVGDERWPLPEALHPAVAELSERERSDWRRAARALAAAEPDPFLRFKALHDYVVTTLEYDHEGLRAYEAGEAPWPSSDPDDVVARGRAVCAGYAKLLAAMGEEAGYEVAYVVGRSTRDRADTDGGRHAWNAVRIEGSWHLADATWNDAGVDDTGDHEPESTYLFTPPDLFVLDHLPDEPRWQLLSEPLSTGEFMRQPAIRPGFALLGLELVQPRRSQVTVSGRVDIVLENPQGAYLIAKARRRDESGETDCQVRRGDVTRVTCDLPRDGKYVIDLYGNREAHGSYPHIAELFANSR